VPDLRGLFLRGLGGNSNSLGQKQTEAINSNTPYQLSLRIGYIYGGMNDIFSSPGCSLSNEYSGCYAHDLAVMSPYIGQYQSTTVYFQTGQNETRPDNQAVRYLIKALK
jgi:hypothetical protein